MTLASVMDIARDKNVGAYFLASVITILVVLWLVRKSR